MANSGFNTWLHTVRSHVRVSTGSLSVGRLVRCINVRRLVWLFRVLLQLRDSFELLVNRRNFFHFQVPVSSRYVLIAVESNKFSTSLALLLL